MRAWPASKLADIDSGGCFAGHLDVLMQQRGAAAEFMQMRKQILSSMLEIECIEHSYEEVGGVEID